MSARRRYVDGLIRTVVTLLCSVVCALGAGIRPGQAAMELGQEKHFDIPPQQLPAAPVFCRSLRDTVELAEAMITTVFPSTTS